jgi:hypothetical protein
VIAGSTRSLSGEVGIGRVSSEIVISGRSLPNSLRCRDEDIAKVRIRWSVAFRIDGTGHCRYVCFPFHIGLVGIIVESEIISSLKKSSIGACFGPGG